MTYSIQKIPAYYGSCSMVGIHGKPPYAFGNYCDTRWDTRLANIWAENLDAARAKFLPDKEIEVAVWEWERGDRKLKAALVVDQRIPVEYLNQNMCFTGTYSPPEEILKEMQDKIREAQRPGGLLKGQE